MFWCWQELEDQLDREVGGVRGGNRPAAATTAPPPGVARGAPPGVSAPPGVGGTGGGEMKRKLRAMVTTDDATLFAGAKLINVAAATLSEVNKILRTATLPPPPPHPE